MNNYWISYNSNLANFMSSNFMTHKPNGIAQLFQMTKNKFNDIKLVNNWIKYKLDLVFENHLWQTQAEIQLWLVKSAPYL